MTVERLKQLYYLPREIRQKEGQLAELRQRMACISSGGGIPSGGSVSDKVGRLASQITDVEQSIKQMEDEYHALLVYIQDIPDSRTRMIFTLRYMRCLPWRQIAVHVGGYNTEDGVRMMHNRYLQKK